MVLFYNFCASVIDCKFGIFIQASLLIGFAKERIDWVN